MKVYLNDEKKSVDPRLLYDILRGLKALCVRLATIHSTLISLIDEHLCELLIVFDQISWD